MSDYRNASAEGRVEYKIYRGTHLGPFFGVAPAGRSVEFETVDVMRVVAGKITEHWGVANLLTSR